jgi:hypothetical protein
MPAIIAPSFGRRTVSASRGQYERRHPSRGSGSFGKQCEALSGITKSMRGPQKLLASPQTCSSQKTCGTPATTE